MLDDNIRYQRLSFNEIMIDHFFLNTAVISVGRLIRPAEQPLPQNLNLGVSQILDEYPDQARNL